MKISVNMGFTLAEALIVLGVIGIVSAMTIPTIIQNYREKVLVNKLKESYSIFSQAYKLAVNEYDSPESWDIGLFASHEGAVKVYNYFKPFLKLGQDCNGEYGCFAKSYKTFSGEQYGDYCAMLYIDVNGYDLPNVAGIDYFGFIITPESVIPLGRPDDSASVGNGYTCTYNGNNSGNGTGCTAWVLKKGNMDYLRHDISKFW